MKSPAQQNIIQIDITNACTHACSNCTRFCGHHPKNFFMDFDTFKKAVDSLVDFPGMVGIMGGEPTLHPEFDKFIRYYAEKIPLKSGRPFVATEPLHDFSQFRINTLNDINVRRGIWSSLGKNYYKHYELIQDTFEYQCINDHQNPGLHQSLMVNRKELGLSDEEWIPLRDNCWIQTMWSAAITPKGAFFCEVAGALDMLFDGPGGWDINSEWWKKTPDEFGEQLKWCELCGAALQTPRRQANDEIDDTGPTFYDRLKKIKSNKLKNNGVNLLDLSNHKHIDGTAPTIEWYLPNGDNSRRISTTNRSIYPQKITAILQSNACINYDNLDISPFDKLIVASSNKENITKLDNIIFFDTTKITSENIMSTVVEKLKLNAWIFTAYTPSSLNHAAYKEIISLVLNPGTLHVYNNNRDVPIFYVFNTNASSWKTEHSFDNWEKRKVVNINCFLSGESQEQKLINAGKAIRDAVIEKINDYSNGGYVIFGAGNHTLWVLEIIKKFKLNPPKYILDDFPTVDEMNSIPVRKPSDLAAAEVNQIIISADPGRLVDILTNRVNELYPTTPFISLQKNEKLYFQKEL